MLSFLKLIRTQNLFIIAFTQYMVRYSLIEPILNYNGFELQLSDLNFFLLVLSTVMIAAAGYIINDYFDIRIDKVNKPERLVIGKGIKRRVAMGSHIVISTLAIAISFYISRAIGVWKLSLVFVICASGLWFYSTTFKRQMLVGNIAIALFTALVPFMVGMFELIPCYKHYLSIDYTISFKNIIYYVIGVSFFAFITTLIREIIKDIEDYEGDLEFGCETLPIVIGKQKTQFVVAGIIVITMGCLAYIQQLQWAQNETLSFYYFLFALQIPMAFLAYKTITAQSKSEYIFAGNTAKLIMLLGVCYLFIFSLHPIPLQL